MIIAQLSDLHVATPGALCYGRVDTNALLERAVEKAVRLSPPPDVVWITGDLVANGEPAEYQTLRELLSPLTQPLYLIPGNHDDRERMRAAFPDHGYLASGEFIQYVVDSEPLLMIGLDTLLPGEVAGEYCPKRLEWLEAQLKEAGGRPVVLFLHHPPFEVGLPMDRHRCRGGGPLGDLVERHPNIQRICCGHVHRLIQLAWRGRPAVVCPSTAHQIALELGEAERSSFGMEPPGFLLHLWREGEGLITHFVPTGDFPGPFPFPSHV